MEDLSETLKKKFLGLYKQKHEVISVKERVVKMNEQRKVIRRGEIFEKRKIPLNMSPVTPMAKRERTPTKKPQTVNKRLEMLAKWKEEKQKRKEVQKKTLKPVFKVSHIPINVGLPNLENVNSEIKGKPFKSKFAPANHEFKPPSNIKPIHFNNASVKSTKIQENTKKGKTEAPVHRMMTRSQARTNSSSSVDATKSKGRSKKVAKVVSKKKKDDKENETKNDQSNFEAVNNKVDQKPDESIQSSLMSPDYPVQNVTSSSDSDVKTPKKTEPPVYISPFVTVSRGKNSARKEYEARKSGKLFSEKADTSSCASPKAGAAYFMWLLEEQTSRLQGLCDQWNKYQEQEELPEEAISMIDVAIGQTNLLLTKKFEQFRGLIQKCGLENCETPVTLEDLHGFWDMMHLQIDNLDKRFENLDNLKRNNWQEILPVIKRAVKKKVKSVKNVKASASLREAILAARRQKQAHNPEQNQSFVAKTPQSRRSSNRLVVVRTEENKRQSSPGLMMMKIAQYAKTVETPAKSILKTETQKSARSQSKTVFFEDDLNEGLDDIENDLNKTNMQSKCKTPTRRSARLSRNKLF